MSNYINTSSSSSQFKTVGDIAASIDADQFGFDLTLARIDELYPSCKISEVFNKHYRTLLAHIVCSNSYYNMFTKLDVKTLATMLERGRLPDALVKADRESVFLKELCGDKSATALCSIAFTHPAKNLVYIDRAGVNSGDVDRGLAGVLVKLRRALLKDHPDSSFRKEKSQEIRNLIIRHIDDMPRPQAILQQVEKDKEEVLKQYSPADAKYWRMHFVGKRIDELFIEKSPENLSRLYPSLAKTLKELLRHADSIRPRFDVKEGEVKAFDTRMDQLSDRLFVLGHPIYEHIQSKMEEKQKALLVMECINSGLDVNETDSEGKSALFHAANTGQEYLVKILLSAGARLPKGQIETLKQKNSKLAGLIADASTVYPKLKTLILRTDARFSAPSYYPQLLLKHSFPNPWE